MPDGSAHITEVSSALEPYFQREVAREQNRLTAWNRHRQTGVSWSGMGAEPFAARTVAQMLADAAAAKAAAEAFANSPRGRFVAALKEMAEIGYGADAERARSCYARGFSDPAKPADRGEIANALLILNPLAGNDARDAREALAEILLEDHRRAA